jgi:hypothetical protein
MTKARDLADNAQNTKPKVIDAKGDLIVGTGADAADRLAVGTNDYILTAASGETTGLKWAAPAGGNKTYTLLNSGGTAMTGASTITVNVTTKEDYYILVMAADSGSRFAMDFRINGDTGANYAFTNIRWDFDGASYSTAHYFSASSTGLTLINMGTASTGGASTVSAGIYVGAGNSTTLHPVSYQTGGTASGGNSHDLITGTAMYSGSAAITSFSFIAGTNFTGGTIYVYGA